MIECVCLDWQVSKFITPTHCGYDFLIPLQIHHTSSVSQICISWLKVEKSKSFIIPFHYISKKC